MPFPGKITSPNSSVLQRTGFVFAFLLVLLVPSLVHAQYMDESDDASTSSDEQYSVPGTDIQIPPGMEIIKSGDINLVVPKGSQMHKVNDLTLMESPEEYAARKFEVVERRLDEIEKTQKEIKEELKRMQGGV